ncbi:MAG: flagellar basal body P-ring protein FlgI [Lentisphaerota bacterium]
MKRILIGILSAGLILSGTPAQAIEARIKDIARVSGLENLELIGYGVVVGLGGTGDKDLTLTKQTMANLLEQFQLTLAVQDVKSKNVAAVIVTAMAPPFHKTGDRIAVQVSSIGDSTSLEGGVLLMTPLIGPSGELYALAQGPLTVGGFSAGKGGPGGETVSKNYTTVGTIPGGAVVKKSQSGDFFKNGLIQLSLRNADFTTATRMAAAINGKFDGSAVARDAGAVSVKIPDDILDVGQAAQFVADLESISLTPDMQAKVIVNERTGTIVMGSDVHISSAVVAHGNLTVNIGSKLTAYMPEPFTTADPVVTEEVTTLTKEDAAKVMLVPGTTTVQELADMLNEMGATPRDLISILEALQKVGALQMEIVSM